MSNPNKTLSGASHSGGASLHFAFGPDLGNLEFELLKTGKIATLTVRSGSNLLVAGSPLSTLKGLISFLRSAEALFPEELGRIRPEPEEGV